MPFTFTEESTPVKQPMLLASCDLCGLHRGSKTPKMPASGPLNAGIYLLGEAPGTHEDSEGSQFVPEGASGSHLRESLVAVGIDINKCRINNALNCYKEGKPDPREVEYCRERLDADLRDAKPKVIIALGGTALRSLGYNYKISFMRGRKIVDPRGFWVVPTFHPSFIIRQTKRPDLNSIFLRDLQLAMSLVDKPLPLYDDWDKNNYLLTDFVKIGKAIDYLKTARLLVVDFETKELKPYSPGADLLTISFSTDGSWGLSFPLSERYLCQEERDIIVSRLVEEIFKNPSITIVAQKMQFELEWLEEWLKGELIGDYDCTMLMSYAIDSRSKAHNLEFMSMVRLGRGKDLLDSKSKEDMSKVPLEKILEYGCVDARLEARIYPQLKEELIAQGSPYEMYQKILKPAVLATVRSQRCGALVDTKLLNHFSVELGNKMDETARTISELDDVKGYEEQRGQAFKLTDDTVRNFLFDFKGYTAIKETTGGEDGRNKKDAVDQEVLAHFAQNGDQFCIWYMKYKRLMKLKSTYVDGLIPVVYPDSRFHTNYNLATTATGRLSSDGPNMQNFPVRVVDFIRRVVIAPEGWVLASYDFKQIEAIIWALFSGDERFIEVVIGGYDIHYEKAKDLFGIEFADAKRQLAKNKFVFPSFFGAGCESIGHDLNLDPELINYHQEKLWREFPRIRQKQFEIAEFYKRNLYVETMTGRRRHGPMSYNELLNAPIQGTASDLTLHAMNRLTVLGFSIPIMVHDDLTFYMRKDCFWDWHQQILDVVMNPEYDWVTLPLKVDTKVGVNWSDMYSLDSAEAKAVLAV